MNKLGKSVVAMSGVVTIGAAIYGIVKLLTEDNRDKYECVFTARALIEEDILLKVYKNQCDLDFCPHEIEDDELAHVLMLHMMKHLSTRCDLQVITKCEVEEDYALISTQESDARNFIFYDRHTGEIIIHRFE